MPLAALFASTIVYGRLAADNELVACRAAGINIYRLFASSILLAVFVALCSVILINYVMPGMVGQIRQFARSNLRGLAEQSLITKGHIAFRRNEQIFLTAPYSESRFDPDALRARGWDPALEYLKIDSPTAMQLDKKGEVVRITTGGAGWIQFDISKDPVEITAIISDARSFEVDQHKLDFERQFFGPIEVELPFPLNPSFLDLNSLIRFQAAPWKFDSIASSLRRFAAQLTRYWFFEHCRQCVEEGIPITLEHRRGGDYVVTAARARRLDKGRTELGGVKVERSEPDPARASVLTAPLAILDPVVHDAEDAEFELRFELLGTPDERVRLDHPGSTAFTSSRERASESLSGLLVPRDVLERLRSYTPAMILDRKDDLGISDAALADAHASLCADAAEFKREIVALYHFRFGFAASALVTILMAAALGIVFRGSRVLAAFGLAAIPFAISVVLVIMGRSNAEKEGMELAGALIIWVGLAGLALADALIIRLGVRR